MTIENMPRVFRYSGLTLPDIEGLDVESVRSLYAATYPEITTAALTSTTGSSRRQAHLHVHKGDRDEGLIRPASSWNRKRVVHCFADPRTQITIPRRGLLPCMTRRDEAELLSHVASVLANVVSGRFWRTCSRIRGHRRLWQRCMWRAPVAGLRRRSRAAVEYVFIAEEIDVLAPLLQLLVKVWIVVRLPTELSDVEIRRYSKAAAEFPQFALLQRLPLKTHSNVLYGVIVFAKALMRAASLGKSLLGVGRHCHTQAAGQSGLPPDEMPFAVREAVFAGLDECCRDANLRRDEVLPLVPCRIPAERKKRGIDIHLRSSGGYPDTAHTHRGIQ